MTALPLSPPPPPPPPAPLPPLPAASPDLPSASSFGLRARMMALMALFVMATELAIFAPSLAQFRAAWLDDRLSDARAAAIALERRPNDPSLAPELLESVGARALYLVENGARRRLAGRWKKRFAGSFYLRSLIRNAHLLTSSPCG